MKQVREQKKEKDNSKQANTARRRTRTATHTQYSYNEITSRDERAAYSLSWYGSE